jgi:choline monooxygenase
MAASRAADVPVLLVRDREGSLRAFLNVCRHRGAQLVDGQLRRATIQCPYHAWTYDLDGTLRSAPRSDREACFDRSDHALVALAVETWGPFVFVNPDPRAEPLTDTLEDLPERVASLGLDVDRLRFHHRVESRCEANWKICCENFLECYHCQVAHPGLAKVLDVSDEAFRLVEGRWFSSQYGPLKGDGPGSGATPGSEAAPPSGMDYDPTGEIGRGQFHFLFPNVTINVFPGRPNLSIGAVLPDGPERTVRFLDYFFAPDADETWIRDMMAWDDQVGVEDRSLVERVQRGVRSGLLDRGVLFRSERLIAQFDRWVMEALELG